jgi:nitrite reductase/ring-hydroxylating ferredoxin subunit
MGAILHPSTDFDQITVPHPAGFQVILVNHDGVVRAWRNRCPHVGVGLDWGDGRCLTAPNELTCMMHGAVFAADSGACLAGPCAGDSLEAVPVEIVGGRVVAA